MATRSHKCDPNINVLIVKAYAALNAIEIKIITVFMNDLTFFVHYILFN